MTTLEALYEVQSLVQAGWIKGDLARMANGQVTAPEYEEACQFCIVGAIIHTTYKFREDAQVYSQMYWDVRGEVERECGNHYLTAWNDRQTKGGVLKVIRSAIKRLEEMNEKA